MIYLVGLRPNSLREQLSLQIVHHLASACLQRDGHLNQHTYRGLGHAPFASRYERDIDSRPVSEFLLGQPEIQPAPPQLFPENFCRFGRFYVARHGHNRPSLRLCGPKHICFEHYSIQEMRRLRAEQITRLPPSRAAGYGLSTRRVLEASYLWSRGELPP